MRHGLLATSCAVMLAAAAPSAAAQQLTWGIKGGVVAASVDTAGSGAFEVAPDAGIAAGVFVGIPLGSGIRFQPELLVTERRYSSEPPYEAVSVSARFLEIPLLVHFTIPSRRRTQVAFFGGPQISVIGTITQSTALGDLDVSPQVKDVDAGATFGGGVEIGAGRGAFVMDARVAIGMRNLNTIASPRVESQAFLVLAGYRF